MYKITAVFNEGKLLITDRMRVKAIFGNHCFVLFVIESSSTPHNQTAPLHAYVSVRIRNRYITPRDRMKASRSRIYALSNS